MANRRDLEIVSHFRAEPLVSGPNVKGKDFPLGEGWFRMFLRFNFAVVIGTGAGPVAEGELLIIKNVLLRTSRGEFICNLPGRALYKIAATKAYATPRKDAIAASTATFSVDIPIYFVDDEMKRPEDTILDSGSYSSITLELTMGSVADLYTAPGTATVTQSLDLEIERTKGMLPPKAKPGFFIQYAAMPPVDANNLTSVDLDRSPDMAYKRLYVHESTGGTPGALFTGVNADVVKNLESVTDQSGDIVRQRIHEQIQNQNKNDYHLEVVLAGITVTDFVRDNSINSALYPGDRSRLQYAWTNKAGVVANDIVSVGFEAIRGLK